MSKTKNRFLGVGIALLALFTIVSCFLLPTNDLDEDGTGPGDEAPIVQYAGTWINPDYEGMGSGKVIVIDHGDGTWSYELYDYISDTVPMDVLPAEVTDEWTDSEGNLWLKAIFFAETPPDDKYQLIKIHADGQTFEANTDDFDYPTEIDPAGDWYTILYRP